MKFTTLNVSSGLFPNGSCWPLRAVAREIERVRDVVAEAVLDAGEPVRGVVVVRGGLGA